MPWCPKCKTEYREGFTVCADCGSELVEEEPRDTFRDKLRGEEPVALLQEDLSGEILEDMWDSEELAGTRSVNLSEKSAGPRFGETADESAAAESVSMDSEDSVSQKRVGGGGLYQDSSERASDNRSSAWVLLGLGSVGLIATVLGAAGILPLRMGNPYLFYGVMGAIFILFVVAGIVSMKNAKFFEKKAESENSLRQTLLDWCGENLKAEEIDAEVCANGVSDEIAYFRRFSCIKEKLNHQFVNLNQGFLDQFIDDYIYDRVFGERAE